MIVFDRILNKDIRISEIEIPAILGRYIFKSDQSTIRLNDCQIKKQDFLVPCKYNEGTLKIKSDKSKLLFHENELLNEDVSTLIKHTLFDVSDELEITDDILGLKDINTLLRNFDERLEVSEFELFLQKKLFHIEEVCREPSYYLKREITKLNVARAKRIPVKAINYLAAHTEDWSRRRIRSVEPRKILTEIVDYDLEIYENQITASFIDKLLVYFSHRMVNEIDVIDSFIVNIERIIESRKRINSTEKIYWYKKLDRDYSKLAKAVESVEKSRMKIEKIKDFISSIQMRLFGLLKSDMYLANSNNKSIISQKLKRTNLFDNHQHYRFIKIIWDKYYQKELLNCSEKSEENQEVVKSFIDYSWVLIFRALFQIGYSKIKKLNNFSYVLTNETIPHILIKIAKNAQQIIEVVINGNEKLTFVPIPSTKDSLKVYPGRIKNKYYFSIVGSKSREDILRISPTDINSEEQISNLLFKYILRSYANAYLFKLNSQSISNFEILNSWLKNNRSLILDKGKNGKIDFWLNRKLNKFEIKELDTIITEQNQNLSARTEIRSKQLLNLKEIEEELKIKSKEHFETYEVCISCSINNQSNITPNYEGGFRYKCNNRGCEVGYGFTEKNIFYNVPDYDKIKNNLSKTRNEINEGILLNAFGFEYI
ncbi:hypothetical protein ACFQ5N_02080 [Lutibacter holmesii]|uniref:DUF2357 domain-containing protein n=1 Tax=Lutibacter holmesii TaxID=1137985 RepID=A0ABW3WMA6_9FLAO